jgi:ankyrin repeat protein
VNSHTRFRSSLLFLGSLMLATAVRAASPADTNLQTAARTGDLSRIQDALATGETSINAKTGPDETAALTLAAAGGHLDIVRLLLSKGADVDARTKHLETPLYFAAANGHSKVVSLLVDVPAGIDLTDYEGRTPLMVAAHAGHLESVKILLDGGANPNATMASGESALFLAADGGHLEIMKALMEMGSLATFTNRNRETPLSIARKQGKKDVIAFLEKAGARMPTPPPGANTDDSFGAPPPSATASVSK